MLDVEKYDSEVGLLLKAAKKTENWKLNEYDVWYVSWCYRNWADGTIINQVQYFKYLSVWLVSSNRSRMDNPYEIWISQLSQVLK